jgi:hypothetical protein
MEATLRDTLTCRSGPGGNSTFGADRVAAYKVEAH